MKKKKTKVKATIPFPKDAILTDAWGDAVKAAGKDDVIKAGYYRLFILGAVLFLPIFATGQNTYRQAMGMPQAPAPVEIRYRGAPEVQRWKPAQPIAVLLPRKVRSMTTKSVCF